MSGLGTLRGVHKDYRDVIAAATDAGWAARRLRSGGVLLIGPSGEHLRIPLSTKSDAKAVRSMLCTIRKT